MTYRWAHEPREAQAALVPAALHPGCRVGQGAGFCSPEPCGHFSLGGPSSAQCIGATRLVPVLGAECEKIVSGPSHFIKV